MANLCGKYSMRGCPASQYLNCEAYATGKNCWEIAKKPCCKQVNCEACIRCSIFLKGREVEELSTPEAPATKQTSAEGGKTPTFAVR
jgi:hypothetical protein